ncbi:MAG: hypothetical protein RR135_02910 [Oscillospiraceae bacterium]
MALSPFKPPRQTAIYDDPLAHQVLGEVEIGFCVLQKQDTDKYTRELISYDETQDIYDCPAARQDYGWVTTSAYLDALRKRQIWCESMFAAQKWVTI